MKRLRRGPEGPLYPNGWWRRFS